ncbi:Uncharacterised protein [Candidatus Burarchaeum australiense]|nr:Uncharacterised protein [Candidatus Burarchaeum australiense]
MPKKSLVVLFGRVILVRSVLLIVIALCIAIVIESNDRTVRALAAAAAIVIEIIRDAMLAGSTWKSAVEATAGKRNAENGLHSKGGKN